MFIFKRLKEGSTWAALTALAALFNPIAGEIAPIVGQVAITIVGAVAGVKAILTRDKGGE